MRDDDCVDFLQWALPRLDMRWAGFRKVRSQVCKRISRRMGDLGLESLAAYRRRLREQPQEWQTLDRMCRVTISRFWRDRGTFGHLEERVLPELAAEAFAVGRRTVDAWSCGCASGEEPYSLAILWRERLASRFPGLRLRVLATDVDLHLLERAGRGMYPRGTVKELPEDLSRVALEPRGEQVRVRDRYRAAVHRVAYDVRDGTPASGFDLVLCRNLAFTYFDRELQERVGRRLLLALRPGGGLVLGSHETPPGSLDGLQPWFPQASIWRRAAHPECYIRGHDL